MASCEILKAQPRDDPKLDRTNKTQTNTTLVQIQVLLGLKSKVRTVKLPH